MGFTGNGIQQQVHAFRDVFWPGAVGVVRMERQIDDIIGQHNRLIFCFFQASPSASRSVNCFSHAVSLLKSPEFIAEFYGELTSEGQRVEV